MSAEQSDERMNFDLTVYSYHRLIEEALECYFSSRRLVIYSVMLKILSDVDIAPAAVVFGLALSNQSCLWYRSALLKIYLTIEWTKLLNIYKLLEQLWHTYIRLRYFNISTIPLVYFWRKWRNIEDFSFPRLRYNPSVLKQKQRTHAERIVALVLAERSLLRSSTYFYRGEDPGAG